MDQTKKELFEIAENQQGFFTAKQANLCGYSPSAQTYHVKAGNWIREHRGIFRLTNFPYSSQTQFIVMALWSMNRCGEIEGVYSHESALVLHDMTDANPSQFYMTVPKHFRRHSTPPYKVELLKETLKDHEIVDGNGYKITTPLRTVLDLMASQAIEDRILLQAIQQFYEKGYLNKKDLETIYEKNKSISIQNHLKKFIHD